MYTYQHKYKNQIVEWSTDGSAKKYMNNLDDRAGPDDNYTSTHRHP